jgi:hypothetical protein
VYPALTKSGPTDPARDNASDALHVADRWHIWNNMCKAVAGDRTALW